MRKWLKELWGSWFGVAERECVPAPQVVRRTVDTQAIRARIDKQGWKLREIPVRRTHPDSRKREILLWKLIAVRGERSIETSGRTIDEAIKNIGMTLGVIPRN